VVLFWKTARLYYVKTDRLFQIIWISSPPLPKGGEDAESGGTDPSLASGGEGVRSGGIHPRYRYLPIDIRRFPDMELPICRPV